MFFDILLIIVTLIEALFVYFIITGIIISFVYFKKCFPSCKELSFSKKYKNKFEHLEKEELWLTNDRGVNLHAYLYKNPVQNKKKKRTLIICSHGWKEDGVTSCANKKLWMFDKYDVLVLDHEGFGKSEGKSTGFGLDDALNLSKWCFKVASIYKNEVNIILYGVSMGANIVMLASSQRLSGVVGIISDSGFSSAYDQFMHVTKSKYITLVCSLFVPLFWRHNLTKYDVRFYLKASRYPFLFIHGKEDKKVSYKMCEENYASCSSKKEIWLCEKADHNEAFLVNEKEYKTKIDNFIDNLINEN